MGGLYRSDKDSDECVKTKSGRAALRVRVLRLHKCAKKGQSSNKVE
jgi:hypothetical protein